MCVWEKKTDREFGLVTTKKLNQNDIKLISKYAKNHKEVFPDDCGAILFVSLRYI